MKWHVLIAAAFAACMALTPRSDAQTTAAAPPPTSYANLVDQGLVAARPRGCARPSELQTDEMIAICAAIDLGRIAFVREPMSRFPYAETNDFDVRLSRAMRSNHNVISVTFPGADGVSISRQQIEAFREVTPETQRIAVWLNRINSNGGKVIFCTRQADGSYQGLNIVTWILRLVIQALNRWTLYGPTRNFHARVLLAPVEGSTTVAVSEVQFIKRGQVSAEALTCAWRPH